MIELMVNDSIDRQGYIELTLQSGKAYVGIPIKSSLAAREQADISMIPIMSGYRQAPTRELKLTKTYYHQLAKRLEKDGQLQELRIVIPLREIVSARPFDLDVFQEFNASPAGDSPPVQPTAGAG